MTMDKICRNIRKTMLEISHIGKDGNLQSCFSSVEILWTLYNDLLDVDKRNFNSAHDRFVLSKGQSNLALMTVLTYKGFISFNELKTFCKFDSRIAMQADRTKFDGLIENSAGSLGHGLPIAVGIAWAAKIKNSGERVFVLVGDGELNEGTMWEAMIFASSEKLDNLTVIVDDNSSIRRLIDIGDINAKLTAFGFEVVIVDGHETDELKRAFVTSSDKPKVVVAKTVRGYGSKTLMTDRSWFHRYPDENELKNLQKEVDIFETKNATMR